MRKASLYSFYALMWPSAARPRGNRFSFLVTNRYLEEFRSSLSDLVAKSGSVVAPESAERLEGSFFSHLTAVSEQEERAIESSVLARLQAGRVL